MFVLGVEGSEKKCSPPPPPPRIISGTALSKTGIRLHGSDHFLAITVVSAAASEQKMYMALCSCKIISVHTDAEAALKTFVNQRLPQLHLSNSTECTDCLNHVSSVTKQRSGE